MKICNIINKKFSKRRLGRDPTTSRSPQKIFNPDVECMRYARGFCFSDSLNPFFETVWNIGSLIIRLLIRIKAVWNIRSLKISHSHIGQPDLPPAA